MKIDTLLREMIQHTEVEQVPKKSKEWIASKDRLLVEILKQIMKDKS